MEKQFAKIMTAFFPHFSYRFNGEIFSEEDALCADGLLSIFVEQALATAKVLGPHGLDGVKIIDDHGSLTGKRVLFGGSAILQLTLPFMLDAAHLAHSQTLAKFPDKSGVIDVDTIIPPLQPGLDTLLGQEEIEHKSIPTP